MGRPKKERIQPGVAADRRSAATGDLPAHMRVRGQTIRHAGRGRTEPRRLGPIAPRKRRSQAT